jgi:hypothetical protein
LNAAALMKTYLNVWKGMRGNGSRGRTRREGEEEGGKERLRRGRGREGKTRGGGTDGRVRERRYMRAKERGRREGEMVRESGGKGGRERRTV